jgi:hypothetical protein
MKKIICLILIIFAVLMLPLPLSIAAEFVTKPDGSVIFLNENGELTKGFAKIKGYTYYFNRDGKMLTGAYFINGSHYRFRDDGKMYIGWVKLADGNYNYYLGDGKRAQGFIKIGSAQYYFRADGIMLRSGGFLINNKIYTFGSDGKLIQVKGNYCLSGYFDESFYDLKSRKPSVIIVGGEKTQSYAADLIPVGFKLDSSYAVGMDLYIFINNRLSGGLRTFSGTSSALPSSVLSSDYDSLEVLTEEETNIIFEKFYSELEKKYGKEKKDSEIISAFDGIDSDKTAIFSDKYTVAVITVKDGIVSQLILDKQTISTIN